MLCNVECSKTKLSYFLLVILLVYVLSLAAYYDLVDVFIQI